MRDLYNITAKKISIFNYFINRIIKGGIYGQFFFSNSLVTDFYKLTLRK